MTVLILVLSAMMKPYGDMLTTSQGTWDSVEHPQTRTLYYVGELKNVGRRTLEAFEYSLLQPWDYMARCHSSTYVHKKNLVDYCETQPTADVFQGLKVDCAVPFIWGGGHFLMSRDVIERFVQNKDKWDMNLMEDNAMSGVATALGIPLSPGRSATIHLQEMKIDGAKVCLCYNCSDAFGFEDWADIKKAHPSFYFRVKQDLMRHLDLEIFRKLHEHYD